MKKLCAVLLCLCLFLAITGPAFAAPVSGYCGEGVMWSYDGASGLLSITGSGSISDYESLTDIPWKAYCPDVKALSVGEGITRIGNNSLTWFEQLYSISLPSSVRELGKHALAWNTGARMIILPSSLKKIGAEAFAGCYNLEFINIPASVESVDSTAFIQCSALKSINADAGNPKYSSVDGVLYCFSQNSLVAYPAGKADTEFTVPENITVIKDSAFRECNNIVTLNTANVTKIEQRAFSSMDGLYNVNLGNVNTIGDMAFYGCGALAKIIIPATVSSVGERAFRACSNLQLAVFEGANTVVGKGAFYGTKNIALVGQVGSGAQNYAGSNAAAFSPIVGVTYNGNKAVFNPPAFIVNGSTLVPMRAVFEMLGAQVSWDQSTRTASAVRDGITVTIQIGSSSLYKNGAEIPLPQAGRLIADSTYVPLRAITEAFGNTVEWNGETYTVTIR